MRTFLIADACNNHSGHIHLAYRMINIAHAAGLDAIKFQLRRWPGWLGQAELMTLKTSCDTHGIEFMCSVFDINDIAWVDPLVDRHKVASGEMTNQPFIKRILECGKPVIVSTGMASLSEVEQCVRFLVSPQQCGYDPDKVTLMQCTSIYPTPYDKVDLRALVQYRGLSPAIHRGLSCHTPSIYTAIAAVAMGAECIEKHMTFDRLCKAGDDHTSSLEPPELWQLVEAVRSIEVAMGEGKQYYKAERDVAMRFKHTVKA